MSNNHKLDKEWFVQAVSPFIQNGVSQKNHKIVQI